MQKFKDQNRENLNKTNLAIKTQSLKKGRRAIKNLWEKNVRNIMGQKQQTTVITNGQEISN